MQKSSNLIVETLLNHKRESVDVTYSLFDAKQRECVRQQKTLAEVSLLIRYSENVATSQEFSEIESQNDSRE